MSKAALPTTTTKASLPSWTLARNEAICPNPKRSLRPPLHSTFTEGRWGREQRNVYLKQFDDAFHTLAESPALGAACDGIMPGYRKFLQGSHVIYFKSGTKSVIEIIRILHQSMDIEAQFHGA
ncbi:MAG: type II toxin-antitoxin system RelE/ParE family toxin [Moraxellaceae bacterium]|nr:type II toxin-antitoxin system RelE/ParE family toxin [Moraxellaceae bacterium]